MEAIFRQLKGGEAPELKGITIDTWEIWKSVIFESQYKAYELEFGRKIPVRPSKKKGLKDIGGSGTVIGEVTIQIPVNKLGITIDVEFALMEDELPSILSNHLHL